jgi:threonine/homoserine/homoserine lactone efflux protein
VAFLVLEVAAIALYALLGMRMARSAGQGRIMRWFNKASGTMMVCFGVVLALMRRPGA